MMATIYKYPLDLVDGQVVSMPEGAEILTAQEQHNQLWIWALVNPDRPTSNRIFEIHSTGNPIAVDMGVERRYVATVQERQFVWHVFERLN
jgi:hypothetical protein